MSAADTAEFLLSAERGCYVAATMETEDGSWACSASAASTRPVSSGAPPSSRPSTTSPPTRVAGRQGRWTPAVLVEAQPNA
jgi:hypothetical protein